MSVIDELLKCARDDGWTEPRPSIFSEAAAELTDLQALVKAARLVVQARKAVDLDRAMQQLAHALAALESEQKGRP